MTPTPAVSVYDHGNHIIAIKDNWPAGQGTVVVGNAYRRGDRGVWTVLVGSRRRRCFRRRSAVRLLRRLVMHSMTDLAIGMRGPREYRPRDAHRFADHDRRALSGEVNRALRDR